MKLLIVGAGYVGKALLTYLQNQHHEIFCTTTQKNKLEELKPHVEHVYLLEDKETLPKLIETCDGMIVLIAPKNGQTYEETYLNTAKTISLALQGRERPFYLLYTSSTSVCEGVETEWVTEEMTLTPKSENAKILLETEKCYLASRARSCILRLGGIYGPHRELIDRACKLSEKEMTSPQAPTNHIHLDDIVRALVFCLDHSLTGVYHLVNDDHPTRHDLYSDLCLSAQVPSPQWNFDSPQIGYKVSNQKIKNAGFVFKHPSLKTSKG